MIMDEEKRRSKTRLSYSAHVLIRSEKGELVKGIARDISLDALYVSCIPAFEVDERVNLEIILIGNQTELNIKVPAKVSRIDEDGTAMNFYSPLEWWPIFSHFPLHKLDSDR